MPTYVYECAKCGDEFEQWQSFADEPLKKHAGCGGKVVKVLQPVGILLKGPGFYRTDNRSAGTNGASKGDRGEKSETSAKSESSSSNASKSDSSSTTSESKSDKKTDKKADASKQPSTSSNKST